MVLSKMEPGARLRSLGSWERCFSCWAFWTFFALRKSGEEGSRIARLRRDLKGFLRMSSMAVRRWGRGGHDGRGWKWDWGRREVAVEKAVSDIAANEDA